MDESPDSNLIHVVFVSNKLGQYASMSAFRNVEEADAERRRWAARPDLLVIQQPVYLKEST